MFSLPPVRDFLFKLLGVLILVGSVGAGWVLMEWGDALQQELVVGKDGLRYAIKKGTSFRSVVEDLAERGVVRDPRYLIWTARWTGKAGRIQAGDYQIRPGTTAERLLDLFVQGKVLQHSFTLVEGKTFRQLMQALSAHPELEHTLAGLSDEQIMETLGYPGVHPEGRFLPETYHFPKGTTDVDILRRAYRDMQTLLIAEWERRDGGLPYKTPDDALIMASIIEKETGRPEERQRIGGVFVRRLERNMRLQTDPTVIYGLGESYDGNLRRRDLKRDTPYNTYVHKGLPPTPIAMPGADSILAALHPETGSELYFVAKGDGSHHFSVTLTEHEEAVAQYQLRRRRNKKH